MRLKKSKNSELLEIVESYENWAHKLEELKKCEYSDKLALLFEWIHKHEINKAEFIYLITRVLFFQRKNT